MSQLKTYSKDTLVGNWFEEKYPPLKGVIPSYKKYESYGTTTSQDSYKHVSKEKAQTIPVGIVNKVLSSNYDPHRSELELTKRIQEHDRPRRSRSFLDYRLRRSCTRPPAGKVEEKSPGL
uniref:Uncharacterized protein n=1 Tax=Aplanochytrium stocchinoi TaxID=215587 RepID=A0A7S3LS71_9STRA|mmetsp:Transcript_2754/g.3490  ORF Transcript_2754/g.3490 Transcript_2754/m.3490 type:complete len:120 (+) Transcript_2754:74-433(+)